MKRSPVLMIETPASPELIAARKREMAQEAAARAAREKAAAERGPFVHERRAHVEAAIRDGIDKLAAFDAGRQAARERLAGAQAALFTCRGDQTASRAAVSDAQLEVDRFSDVQRRFIEQPLNAQRARLVEIQVWEDERLAVARRNGWLRA